MYLKTESKNKDHANLILKNEKKKEKATEMSPPQD